MGKLVGFAPCLAGGCTLLGAPTEAEHVAKLIKPSMIKKELEEPKKSAPSVVHVVTNKPLSVNSIWKKGRGGQTYKVKEAVDWQEVTAWLIKDQYTHKFAKASLHVVFRFEDKRRRDLSNHMKLIEDAVVDSGLIEDDNWMVLRKVSAEGVLDEANPRVEITITEIK